ncbi:MAG: DUF433 domain-containing protein [Pirellulaceae bacterium]
MVLTIAVDPLPLRLDEGGTYRVGPTRVRLDTVVFAYNQGTTAEQIVGEFPSLDLADVHAVISYYLRHKTDVDAYLSQREREAEELREQIEALPKNKALREKLIALRRQRG